MQAIGRFLDTSMTSMMDISQAKSAESTNHLVVFFLTTNLPTNKVRCCILHPLSKNRVLALRN
jgi:hypothetical protein